MKTKPSYKTLHRVRYRWPSAMGWLWRSEFFASKKEASDRAKQLRAECGGTDIQITSFRQPSK